MIDLGATDFYIDVPSLPRLEFERYSTKLFDEWEAYVEQVLKIPDYSLALEVEEGSIKGGAKIATALCALYIGIGQYGSFISGLQTIQGQISSIGDFLATHATMPFSSGKVKPRIKKHNGSLGELQKLFFKIQQGKITAEQAMLEAEVMFGDEAKSEPDFMDEMKNSFENTPLLAKQLNLPLNAFEQDVFLQINNKKRQPRSPRPRPEPPIGQQFRVEVWRDSKKEKRKVRVMQL
ncbi:hypothetical protein [Pseudomonas sp. 24 E 13]|uniref:hypothetical protein n=1 Tax=unclassified Pseudomonas TaxID=196821 RepID=UPI000811F3D5|nr:MULTISPECIES: hypothetical protein [unclassified Pseudomonas]MDO4233524.1 hypothetical protein [Pseudomonas sp.]CRM70420.1 hypothetical protein [Pseudomonas sp. 24 E 13]